MSSSPSPSYEALRLQHLRALEILDTPPERAYDDLTQLAAHLCGTPAAGVSLVDEHRQWFKSRHGLDAAEIARESGFCAHVVANPGQLLIVPNAIEDERFAHNPLVTGGPRLRFYAGAAIHDPDGYPLGALCVVDSQPRNLSDRQRELLENLARQVEAHLALRQRLIELRAERDRAKELCAAAAVATKAKQSFLAHVSHELRTPLNAIIGMSGLLNLSKLTDEQQEFASTIQQSGEYLLSILNSILDFSKLEAGCFELEHAPLSLADCVESAVEMLAGKAAQKRLELVCRIDSDVPLGVYGDQLRIRQVLTNLISNAVKFTESGDVTVRVRTVPGGDPARSRVRFEVSDTGLGIAPEKRPRLFRSFSQLDSSMSRRFGGTGLGLAISQQLVQLMKSTIEVDGGELAGSIFSFTIDFERVPGTTDAPVIHLAQRRRVLIVHRNAAVRETLAAYVEGFGCTALTATPEQAASSATPLAGDADTLIVDQREHATVCADVFRQGPTCGVVVLREPIVTGPEDLPASAFSLTKPVKRADLFAALHRSSLSSTRAPFRPRPEPPARPARELSILIAEDNIVNQRVAAAMLKRCGYSAVIAADGRQALELCRARAYDLVLMDLQMPHMDGFEATREIRRLETVKQPIIIATTASVTEEDRNECAAAGMDDMLCKPVRVEDLSAALRRVERALATSQPYRPSPAGVLGTAA